ncbi:MAG: HRDC domain-containing protein [Planctomycetes bacterium]|nr:HRDC domain-containing protein [Planctomycetota bacterium]
MQARVIAIPFRSDGSSLDDTELVELLAAHDAVTLREYFFFTPEGVPHMCCFVQFEREPELGLELGSKPKHKPAHRAASVVVAAKDTSQHLRRGTGHTGAGTRRHQVLNAVDGPPLAGRPRSEASSARSSPRTSRPTREQILDEQTLDEQTLDEQILSERPLDEPPLDEQGAILASSLRAWRVRTARERGVPAYRVLSNRTLDGIARQRPANAAALSNIEGVGRATSALHGEAILELVRSATDRSATDFGATVRAAQVESPSVDGAPESRSPPALEVAVPG